MPGGLPSGKDCEQVLGRCVPTGTTCEYNGGIVNADISCPEESQECCQCPDQNPEGKDCLEAGGSCLSKTLCKEKEGTEIAETCPGEMVCCNSVCNQYGGVCIDRDFCESIDGSELVDKEEKAIWCKGGKVCCRAVN